MPRAYSPVHATILHPRLNIHARLKKDGRPLLKSAPMFNRTLIINLEASLDSLAELAAAGAGRGEGVGVSGMTAVKPSQQWHFTIQQWHFTIATMAFYHRNNGKNGIDGSYFGKPLIIFFGAKTVLVFREAAPILGANVGAPWGGLGTIKPSRSLRPMYAAQRIFCVDSYTDMCRRHVCRIVHGALLQFERQ